jgi:predicted O-linked N-acetylglucosamine transferase (SPINDLY family)
MQPEGPKRDNVAVLLLQADAARERRDSTRSVALYNDALNVDPDNLYALYWLATLQQELGDLAAAKGCCERGLAIDPDQIGLLLRFGSVATAAIDPMLALGCYERIARLDPEVPEVDALLADQYCLLGRLEEGIAAFDRALARQPDSIKLQSNRLFVLNYAKLLDREALFDEHRRWGAQHEERMRRHWIPFRRDLDPDKRLRIGYVSPDLRDHPVAAFIEPLLRAHDRGAFEIHCFDTSGVAEDHVTARMKPHADVWRRVGDLGDEALAGTIRASGIDVLIDLSGHTGSNRLLAFAMKPAPIQATWLGYLNTTGLAAMDYRITDDYLDPEGTSERFHTETLFRIPNHACFSPSPESPPASPPPAAREGVVTFGSVNQWPKVNDEVKDVWAALLKNVDRSRLVVVARGGQNPAFRDRIVAHFVSRGVGAEQIRVTPALPHRQFLELLADIDITLDPFPYGGGTTTMHSLWMGVPVVTLAGATAFARNSIGPLSEVELGQLIAETPDHYVEIAAGLARSLPGLAQLRTSLRERLLASPLMDERRFARNMELALTAMWRNHCAGAKTVLRVR